MTIQEKLAKVESFLHRNDDEKHSSPPVRVKFIKPKKRITNTFADNADRYNYASIIRIARQLLK